MAKVNCGTRSTSAPVPLRLPTALCPLDVLAAAPFPKLVVSGGHAAPFDAVCDVLERRLPAERAVIVGRGHAVQMTGQPFNEQLATFISSAEAAA